MADDVTVADGLPVARFLVETGGQVIQEVTLGSELSIGRAEDNHLRLTDPKVSRHHARVVREGNAFILTDLGSANGTLVEGVRLVAPHRLRHGDQVSIGDADLIYQEAGRAFEDTITAQVVVPPLVPAATPASPPPSREERSKQIPAVAIIVALVAVILVLGGVILYLLKPDFLGAPGPVSQATPTLQPEVVSPTATPVSEAPANVATTAAPPPTPEASPTATVEPVTEVDDLMVQAEALTRRGKFEEALIVYEDLVRRAPDDARPEAGWAWTLILDGEADRALEHALRAVELNLASSDAAAALARAYVETGDKAPALAEAQRAVELDPGNVEAQAVLAEAYLLNDQTEEAAEQADLALVQDANNAEAHRIRGWLYHLVDNDLGRAVGELQTAAGLEPDLWLRRHELGLLLLQAENYSTAILALQDALDMRPKAVTYAAIGEAYYRLEQYDQAQASLQQALSASAEDADTYALLGAVYASEGRCDEARDSYEQALVQDPAHPVALAAKDLCEGTGPPPSPLPGTDVPPVPTPGATPRATPGTAKPSPRPSQLTGRIAFPVWNRERGKYDVYVAQVDGSGRRLVVEEMHQPAFSPDGGWLAVNGERDEHMNLHVVRPNGSGLKEISKHLEDGLPEWSPDGKGLVFSSTMHGDRQSRVYIIDQVSFEGRRKEEGRPLNFGPDDVRGEHPAWGLDGRIVYKGCDYLVQPAKCGLFSMSANPGPQAYTQLTEHPEDSAPAARTGKIAFMSNRDGNWEIYAMNSDGSGLERLTKNAAHDGLPTWSPDAQTIAFVSNQGGAWAIWAMNPDGTNRRKLFDIGGGGLALEWQKERIGWAP